MTGCRRRSFTQKLFSITSVTWRSSPWFREVFQYAGQGNLRQWVAIRCTSSIAHRDWDPHFRQGASRFTRGRTSRLNIDYRSVPLVDIDRHDTNASFIRDPFHEILSAWALFAGCSTSVPVSCLFPGLVSRTLNPG